MILFLYIIFSLFLSVSLYKGHGVSVPDTTLTMWLAVRNSCTSRAMCLALFFFFTSR